MIEAVKFKFEHRLRLWKMYWQVQWEKIRVPFLRVYWHPKIEIKVGMRFTGDAARYYSRVGHRDTMAGPHTYILRVDAIDNNGWFSYTSEVLVSVNDPETGHHTEWETISQGRKSTIRAFKDEIMLGHLTKLPESTGFKQESHWTAQAEL